MVEVTAGAIVDANVVSAIVDVTNGTIVVGTKVVDCSKLLGVVVTF